jgi:predicted DNA-binding transcriptional regulator YafY
MKIVSRPQYARLRRILEMIRAGTRSGGYPSASAFARDLEVSWRTIIRDLDYLRDDAGAPIEYDASRKGYRLEDQTWTLPPVELNAGEVFAFSVARRLVAVFKGTALEMDIGRVFDKIAESLEGRITLDVEALTDRFTVLHEDYVVQDPEVWSAVAKAVERREELQVTYEKFNGEEKSYVLRPYHLVSYHGNWYVLAADGADGGIKTFAVSRIHQPEPTGQVFDLPPGLDIKERIERSFGIGAGDTVRNVRLRFSSQVAAYIRERVWHPKQQVRPRRDGGVDLLLPSANWKELMRWILSWQPDVRVLAPKRLGDRIQEKLKLGLASK